MTVNSIDQFSQLVDCRIYLGSLSATKVILLLQSVCTLQSMCYFQYLGEDLQDVHGKVLFDEGSVVTLPTYDQVEFVLVPGQIVPMHLNEPSIVAMIRTAAQQQKTIAILHYR